MNTVTTTMNSMGVTTITLNRTNKHNAFDGEMVAQLTAAFEKTTTNAKARILVLAATGNTFSSGADLHWMKHKSQCDYEENLRDAEALARLLKTLNEMPQPTIARIQGPAFGGALGLIGCCDIAIAVTGASFAFSEVRSGLIPAMISPYIIKAIGSRAARRYFITGETFDAQQAMQLGLIHDVVDKMQLDNKISTTIDNLLKNSPAAMYSSKQLVQDVAYHPINSALIRRTCKRIVTAKLSKQGQEGLSAFLEKRKPNWQQEN